MFKYPKGSILLENQLILLSHAFVNIQTQCKDELFCAGDDVNARYSKTSLHNPLQRSVLFLSRRLCCNAVTERQISH